jgi:hypothetical protein
MPALLMLLVFTRLSKKRLVESGPDTMQVDWIVVLFCDRVVVVVVVAASRELDIP